MQFCAIFLLLLNFSFAFADDLACSETSGASALVIIDMQPSFTDWSPKLKTPENLAKVDAVIQEQIAAIEQAKQNGLPIVFIESEDDLDRVDKLDLGETDKRLKEAVTGYSRVKFIKKTKDAILDSKDKYKGILFNHLKQLQIGTMLIMGANGSACVKNSIINSLKNNCNVTVYSKGVADFNQLTFIHPYSGHYTEIKPDCKNCTFKEVHSLSNFSNDMLGPKPEAKEESKSGKGQR